jgi:hypothetical protein
MKVAEEDSPRRRVNANQHTTLCRKAVEKIKIMNVLLQNVSV